MDVHDHFSPDGARAQAMDRRVRDSLADSIESVLGEWGDDSGLSAARVASCLRAIREAPVSPGVFGLYTDLVEALSADDRRRGRMLIEQLFDTPPPRATFRIATLDDAELGPTQAERYRRLIGEAEGVTLCAVSADAKPRAAGVLADALGLLAQASPDYAGEIQALIREFVFVCRRRDDSGGCFASATTFYLWGAIVLDEACASDRLTLAVTLVHEAAHAYLFGMTLGEKMVENPDDERFGSPLRQDQRPMEGVFHATFVLARMIDLAETVVASGFLTPAERAALVANLADLRLSYAAGRATVAAHARLTDQAARLLAEADDRVICQAARLVG